MGHPVDLVDVMFSAPDERRRPCRWGASIAIGLPPGVTRHPRLLDVVEDEIDRVCVVDLACDGVKVAFGAHGDDYEAAFADVGALTDRVLGRLGLAHSDILVLDVYERDLGVLDGHTRPRLEAVPDLDSREVGR